MSAKLEFLVSPNGSIVIDEEGKGTRSFTEKETELCKKLLEMISSQYPGAYIALSELYDKYRLNKTHYDFLRVHRFIRCNFGKFDGLSWDIDGSVLNIEDVSCPIRCECPFLNVICKPVPLGLTPREAEVASMTTRGFTYKEISKKLGISHSTIKNILQKVKRKLKVPSSKDIARVFIATL